MAPEGVSDVDQAKRDEARLAELGYRQELVRRVARYPWHRRDGLRPAPALDHEDRIDQVVGGKHVLAHQSARELVTSHAAHPHRGKTAVDLHDYSFLQGGSIT